MDRVKSFYGVKNTRFREFFSWVSAILLLTFVYNHRTILQNPFLGQTPPALVYNWNLGTDFHVGVHQFGVNHRTILEVDRNVSIDSTKFDVSVENSMTLVNPKVCAELYEHKSYKSHCDYLIAHPNCTSGGILNYIKFFYCDCGKYTSLAYVVLGAWLVVLFYLLGNTAADYFCSSLEKLSDLLKLSPTVAGVSLLPLGNGAPDVFASVAAFLGSGSGDVGLNSVLGGAVFVTCIVVGVVSIIVADKRVQIDRKCFIRDFSFFLLATLCIAMILIIGKVSIGGALAFLSIYVVYAFSVALNEILRKKGQQLDAINPLLPVAGECSQQKGKEDESIYESLLNDDANDDTLHLVPRLPHWIWASNVAIYSDYMRANVEDSQQPLWGWSDGEANKKCSWCSWSTICWLLETPLTIPRRLTIPIVEEERWSKGYAVASALFAPILLAILWNAQANLSALSREISCFIGFGTGCILGILAFKYTKSEHPPRKFLLPWVVGGFFMSIIWFYIIANELVALLISLGIIFGISPSILALTLLAWGNSMGDFMSNTALAMNERNGVHIAISGCYAGPMFNMLVGLGLSLLLGAFSTKPEPYVVPQDNSLYYTVGFLVAGLIWALMILPLSDMRLNKRLGVGLIIIYLMFLCFRIGIAMGGVS
ncbi:hypothetical protein Ancab_027585 [Ancistrocladus abbreviatus]